MFVKFVFLSLSDVDVKNSAESYTILKCVVTAISAFHSHEYLFNVARHVKWVQTSYSIKKKQDFNLILC